MKLLIRVRSLVFLGMFCPLLFSCTGGGGGADSGDATANDGDTIINIIDSPQSDDSTDSEPSENPSVSTLIICWHGKSEHEFIVAYPNSLIESGVSLSTLITTTPWDGSNVDLANDSLKMCSIDNQWYGDPDPNPWFPKVSFIQLSGNTFVVCENSSPCGGESWNLEPGLPAPIAVRDLVDSNQSVTSPTIIGFERTDILF